MTALRRLMNMNWRIIWRIALKDWKEILHNRMVLMPALITPLIFTVFLPGVILSLSNTASLPGGSLGKQTSGAALIAIMPPAVREQLTGLNIDQATVVLLLGFFLAPLFLMVPLLVASVIGADSIVGEKERKTLEALLYTPASDGELYIAKLISSVVPAIAVAWLSFGVYIIVTNVLGAPLMGRIWFPLPHWWPLIFWVSPAVALLGMSVIVLVSSRVSTFTGAQQISGLVAMPIVLLVIGQVVGIVSLGVVEVFALGAVIWIVDAGLIWIGVKQFSRSALMARI
ncbi:MAG: ABC transporter permease subunit [Chloroflexota bacterium]